jgi:hypothetical protein
MLLTKFLEKIKTDFIFNKFEKYLESFEMWCWRRMEKFS